MKVSKIDIENVLGIEHLTFIPGTITVVEGRNGSGKTSTLEAIRSALRGGHDPSLLRAGAAKGTVRLGLEDGTEIVKTVTPDGSQLKVVHPQHGRISKGQALVDSLVDSLGVDPLALVSCPAPKRAEYLADLLAVEIPDAELREAAGRSLAGLRLPAAGLDRLEAVRAAVYDDRTGINRVAKDKRATAAQLRETLPASEGEVPDVAALRAQKAAGEAALASSEKAASAKRNAALEAIRSTAQAEIDAARAAANARIREIEGECDTAVERIKARAQEQVESARTTAEDEHRKVAAELGPQLEGLAVEIARAEEREKEHIRAEKTREILAAAEEAASAAEARSKELTAALERLDALRERYTAQPPVKGLSVRDGQVLVDGLPFERINQARQIQIAFEVAKLRAGEVGLVVADGMERLDAEAYEQWEKAAAAAGLQFVVSRVGTGELKVRTIPASEEAA